MKMKDVLVSRNELRDMMKVLPTEYLWEKENIAPVIEYLDVIKKIKSYILIGSNFGCVQTNKLSERQSTLSDTILRYLVNGAYDRIDDIYHELYDFIDNRIDENEFLDYAEIIVLKQLVDIIIYTLEKEISSYKDMSYIEKKDIKIKYNCNSTTDGDPVHEIKFSGVSYDVIGSRIKVREANIFRSAILAERERIWDESADIVDDEIMRTLLKHYKKEDSLIIGTTRSGKGDPCIMPDIKDKIEENNKR